jgi:uncharacterized protein (TIGR02271 family)
VSGPAGEPLGRVATVYTDPSTGAATWAAVDVGGASALVPVDRVSAAQGGLGVPFDAEVLRTAPAYEPGANLSHDDVARLSRHYAQPPAPPSGQPSGVLHGAPQEGPGWMVRHEERLRVLTDTVVTGRVRVRKYLVTEEQTFTVEVTHEEIHIDHEEVPLAERAGLPADVPAVPLGEQVLELVLHEEQVVVTKQVVPIERVRVVRSVVTRPEIVRGVVRREVLDLQDPRS